jgi:hypothetical protein
MAAKAKKGRLRRDPLQRRITEYRTGQRCYKCGKLRTEAPDAGMAIEGTYLVVIAPVRISGNARTPSAPIWR